MAEAVIRFYGADALTQFYNDCHNDSGSEGGQFCGTPGSGSGSDSGGGSGSVSTSKVGEAFDALSSGKSVELTQKKDLAKLVERIGAAVPDPTKGPVMDLCRVKGFCAGNKGIARADMPQLKGIPAPGNKADALPHLKDGRVDIGPIFLQSLRDKGVKVVDKKSVSVSDLKPTQTEVNGARVAQVLAAHPKVSGTVYASSDGYVLDGTHHWAAAKISGSKNMEVIHIDMPIKDLVAYTNEFAKSQGIPHKSIGD